MAICSWYYNGSRVPPEFAVVGYAKAAKRELVDRVRATLDSVGFWGFFSSDFPGLFLVAPRFSFRHQLLPITPISLFEDSLCMTL